MTQVSVVVPTRNRRGLLLTTLHSVAWQQGVELEVIVVDDASEDGTSAAVASLGDARIRVLRNDVALGPAGARNRGATLASGEWLAFVDDDDVWSPDKLASQVLEGEATGRGWVYAGALNVGADLSVISVSPAPEPESVVAALPRYNPVPAGGSNVVIRRSHFAATGGFDDRLAPCEDWELWARLAQHGLPAAVDEPLVGYRVHGANSSLDLARITRAAHMIEDLHGARVDWGRLHRWMAESCLRAGDRPAALAQFARAAVLGQATGVVSDLGRIGARRLRRAIGAGTAAGRGSGVGSAEAAQWLRELAAVG